MLSDPQAAQFRPGRPWLQDPTRVLCVLIFSANGLATHGRPGADLSGSDNSHYVSALVLFRRKKRADPITAREVLADSQRSNEALRKLRRSQLRASFGRPPSPPTSSRAPAIPRGLGQGPDRSQPSVALALRPSMGARTFPPPPPPSRPLSPARFARPLSGRLRPSIALAQSARAPFSVFASFVAGLDPHFHSPSTSPAPSTSTALPPVASSCKPATPCPSPPFPRILRLYYLHHYPHSNPPFNPPFSRLFSPRHH